MCSGKSDAVLGASRRCSDTEVVHSATGGVARAHLERAVSGQPDPIAAATEWFGHGGDEAHRAGRAVPLIGARDIVSVRLNAEKGVIDQRAAAGVDKQKRPLGSLAHA